jgi:poly(rC)-binding protein 3/4
MGKTGKRNRDDRSHHRNNFKGRQINSDLEASGSDANKLVVYRVICPDTVIGSVIGKAGKVINKIWQETHARVKVIDPYLGSDKRVITISSFRPDKDLSGVDELSVGLDPLCPAQEALIKVHEAIVDALKNARDNEKKSGGRGGGGCSTIKRVRDSTRAFIKVSPKDPADATHSCALEFDNFLYVILSLIYRYFIFICRVPSLINPFILQVKHMSRVKKIRET